VPSPTQAVFYGFSGGEATEEGEQRWLFLARCQQRSAAERDIYSTHVAAMEEAGEDFFGNFS